MKEPLGLIEKVTLGATLIPVAFAVYVAANPDAYLASMRGAALYLGLPLLSVGVVAATFLLPRRLRVALFVSGWTFVSTLYAFELYFRTWGQPEGLPAGADLRTKAEVVRDLRSEGIVAYPSVTSKSFRDAGLIISINGDTPLPLAGIPNVTTVLCNESGTWTVYVADRYGLSNPDSVWERPAQIAVVGDSFVHGACTSPGDSIAGLLRRAESATVNLGAKGSAPLAQLAALREYGALARPRHVVWFYNFGDLLGELEREMPDPVLSRYLDPRFSQGLAARSQSIGNALASAVEVEYERALREGDERVIAGDLDDPEAVRRDRALETRFNPLGSVSWLTLQQTRMVLGLFEGGNDWVPPDKATFRTILAQARREVQAWGGTLHLVAIPHWPAVVGNDPEYLARYRKAGVEVAIELDIPAVDLTQVFREQADPRGLFAGRQPNHYSERGYALVAHSVATMLGLQISTAAADR